MKMSKNLAATLDRMPPKPREQALHYAGAMAMGHEVLSQRQEESVLKYARGIMRAQSEEAAPLSAPRTKSGFLKKAG